MAETPRKRTGRKPTAKRRTDADGAVTVAGKAGNGEGSVYWSASARRWEAKGHHPTTGTRIKRTGSTREQATRRLTEAMEAGALTKAAPLGSAPTVAALLGYYVAHVAEPRVAPTTLVTYRKQASTVVGIMGDRPVPDLTKADGQALVAALHRGHSHDWATGCTRLAKRALGEAIDLGYLSTNPLDRVRSPERPDTARRVLTLDEQRRLVAEALTGNYRHGIAVALLFTLGLRVSEVLALRWEDLDYDAEEVNIARAVVYVDGVGPVVGPTKTHRTRGARHLPGFLHAPLKKLHRLHLEESLALGPHADPGGCGFIFVGTRHQLVNRQAITKEVGRICAAVGIDPDGIATHTGRRTVITALYVDGAVTEDIAAAVGHSDPSTTRGYVQSLGDRPTITARRMAALLAAASEEP